RALRALHFLPSVKDRNDAAELAAERAADAGMMNRGAAPQKRRQQVLLDGLQPVVGKDGKIVRRAKRARRIMYMQSERVFKRKAGYARILPIAAECGEKRGERFFALPFDHEVNVARIESGIGVERREISAPDNRHGWISAPEFLAGPNCGDH